MLLERAKWQTTPVVHEYVKALFPGTPHTMEHEVVGFLSRAEHKFKLSSGPISYDMVCMRE